MKARRIIIGIAIGAFLLAPANSASAARPPVMPKYWAKAHVQHVVRAGWVGANWVVPTRAARVR